MKFTLALATLLALGSNAFAYEKCDSTRSSYGSSCTSTIDTVPFQSKFHDSK